MITVESADLMMRDSIFNHREILELLKSQAQEIEDNELRIHNSKGKIEELENEIKELKMKLL